MCRRGKTGIIGPVPVGHASNSNFYEYLLPVLKLIPARGVNNAKANNTGWARRQSVQLCGAGLSCEVDLVRSELRITLIECKFIAIRRRVTFD